MEKTAQELTIQSFERSQNLLEYINLFVIHVKLSLKGKPDGIDPKTLELAKNEVRIFLQYISVLVQDADSAVSLKGADMRLRSLIRNYADAKQRNRLTARSVLFRQSPEKLLELLESDNKADKETLVKALTELRTVLEEHIVADSKQLINDF